MVAVLSSLILTVTGCSKILGIDETTRGDRDASLYDATTSDAETADAQDPTVVVGSVSDTYVFNDEEIEVPRDLSATQVQALLGDGIGGYTIRPATLGADGSFTIPNMPQEAYWLRVGDRYYRTTQRVIKLTSFETRRPVVSYPAVVTPLAFNITGLLPWQGDSRMEVSSPAGVTIPIFGGASFPSLTADATALTDQVDYNLLGAGNELPLLEGDALHVTQSATRQASGSVTYNHVVSYSSATPVSQTDGQLSTLSASMSVIAADTHHASVSWQGAAFAALPATMCPVGGLPLSAKLSAYAVPSGLGGVATRGLGLPTLMSALLSTGDETLTFDFANPLGGASGVILETRQFCPIFNDGMATRSATYLERMPFSTSPSLGPNLGPPLIPVVGASDARQELVLSVPSADIAWTRPSLGSAEGFVVTIFDIGDPTGSIEVARFYTPDTIVRLPPGILEVAHAYAMTIAATIGLDPLTPSQWDAGSISVETLTAPIIVDHPPRIYVDADGGSDTNRGTAGSPFKTISHALSVATTGNVVRVESGTYDVANGESFPLRVGSGVTLESVLGPDVIIRGAGTSTIHTVAVILENDAVASGLVIDKDDQTNGDSAAVLLTGARCQVLRNTIPATTNQGTGILTGFGADHVFRDNTITGHAIGIRLTADGATALIAGNQISGNNIGVQISSPSSGTDLGGGAAGSEGGNTISCNTSYDIHQDNAQSVSAQDNMWDHVPPLTSTTSPTSGDDIFYVDGTAGLLDTTGAALATSPCP